MPDYHLAWAGGTNSVFLRMSNRVTELEKHHHLSPDEAEVWRGKIQTLRLKVDERIQKNGGGMNPHLDQDLFDEINAEGKKLFEIDPHAKQRPFFHRRY